MLFKRISRRLADANTNPKSPVTQGLGKPETHNDYQNEIQSSESGRENDQDGIEPPIKKKDLN